jgi:hypothetical protein
MNKRIWKIISAFAAVFILFAPLATPVHSQSDSLPNGDAAQAQGAASSLQFSQHWLERVNYYRQVAGLAAVVESQAYNADLAKHVAYMLFNVPAEGLWHGETPGRPGYTPEGDRAAEESNLLFGGSGITPAQAIDAWMNSIQHRYGILRPDLTTTGFGLGCDSQNCGAGLNVIRGIVWNTGLQPNGVIYPGPDQRGVNRGVTLTWQFLSDSTVALKSASLQDSSGQSIPFAQTSPPNGDYFNMVSVDPNALLSPGARYTASITVQLGAAELSRTWSFTTLAFQDVQPDYWSWEWIERLYAAGITGGCGNGNYCPDSSVTRAEMAVFLLRGIHDATYAPPGAGAGTGFGDVPLDYWSASWIKQLAAEGITTGCGSGNYCPEQPVTRAQMAVFLLRSKYGASYVPPPVGSGTGFGDVPPDYWAAAWIKQLVTEGITAGCGSGNYCPESPVTRAQMAVFLVRTFGLP